MTDTENRLRDALSAAAAATAENIRPLTVPARRRLRAPFRIAAAALVVAVVVFGAVRLATPSPLSRENTVAMAMSGPEQSGDADVSVFLCKRHDRFPNCDHVITEDERAEIRRTLEARPEVKRVLFEDQQQAWENFRSQNTDKPALLKAIVVEDMSESFRAWLRPGADPNAVARAMGELPGVSNAIDRPCLLRRLSPWSLVEHVLPWSDEPEQCSFPEFEPPES
ncbi:permease-like cell division protein FtsX [Streptosporangium amethystogenes]|uniref:permease-like cell division protein FtsX n=1 Tax=Streptosporangium amethystogenes TaxID=2002 RepID=UPI0004C96E38|nr:permease-like cell division protein FtsX [Streptosporangium amethystogenes]